ncbi:SIS domain-containing protein [bacterium]|nr:SIS domain-containing protein [bacterium]
MEIKEYIKNSISVKTKILEDENFILNIQNAANEIINAYKNNKKVLIAGNGGSAADSNHIAAEFVSRFLFNRSPLAAVSLSANQSVLTAIGNDYNFSDIFSRQIEALGNKGDIFIAISTSGVSENIIKALDKAKEKGLKTIFLTGQKALYCADYTIKAPDNQTSHIQEAHIMIAHIICAIVEEKLFRE